jgi:hypothetical protein
MLPLIIVSVITTLGFGIFAVAWRLECNKSDKLLNEVGLWKSANDRKEQEITVWKNEVLNIKAKNERETKKLQAIIEAHRKREEEIAATLPKGEGRWNRIKE